MTDDEATLPPELIIHVLQSLDDDCAVSTLLACTRVSRSFASLAQHPAVWIPLLEGKWKRGTSLQPQESPYEYYKRRAKSDLQVRARVKVMASRGYGRLPLIQETRELGEDAIEVLQDEQPYDPELRLTERYWACETRRGIFRDLALKTWKDIQSAETDEDDAFERGAHAFVAFRGADPAEVLERYDMSRHQALLGSLSTNLSGPAALRFIARKICQYMKNDLGLIPATAGSFHNIDNHFLNLVWANASSSMSRGTLPMSLVIIFCSLVRRLPASFDIQARPVGFPGVLLAGISRRGSEEMIYVNVFDGGRVLELSDLARMLNAMDLTMQPEFVRPATAKEMCVRIARNILTSVRTGDDPHPNDPLAATASLYAVACSLFILSPPQPTDTYASWCTQLCQAEFSSDLRFLREEVAPSFRTPSRVEEVLGFCEAIEEEDEGQNVVVKSREEFGIKWRLGHVFRHRLFGYVAVIRGFDETCLASEQWIQGMGVDTLRYGRHQPFYHVITEDGSGRYVAQENITNDRSVAEASQIRLAQNELVGRYCRKRQQDEDGRWGFAVSEEVKRMYTE